MAATHGKPEEEFVRIMKELKLPYPKMTDVSWLIMAVMACHI